MKITIIGGGNIGTLMAAEMAYRGGEVTVYTSKPERWSRELTVFDADDRELLRGGIKEATDDIRRAVDGADVIWVCTPSTMFRKVASELEPAVKPGQVIGAVPGSGGAEFAFAGCIQKGCTLIGLQRVHSIARLKEYGSSVYQLGRKDELQLGSIPADRAAGLCAEVSEMFDMPCVALPNYLCVTLTPSNPILHTTRLYTLFRDWRPGSYYPRNFLFYEEWTDESSQALLDCDDEEQALCGVIPLELKDVKSLRLHYESPDAKAMTAKISGIRAFKGLTSPMKEEAGGWTPDLDSRYFTADFSYGLKIIRDVAELFGSPAPMINKVWNWYLGIDPKAVSHEFCAGFTKESFTALYR